MTIIIINPKKEKEEKNMILEGKIIKKTLKETNCGLIKIEKGKIIRGGKEL